MEDITPEVREFLSCFKARPGMYTGHDGMLTDLALFFDGMKAFPLVCNTERITIIPQELHDFTAKHYGEGSSVAGWRNIILDHELDERRAFDKFWELLDGLLVSEGYEPLEKKEIKPTNYERSDRTDRILYCDLAVLTDSFRRVYEWDRDTLLSRFRELYRAPGFLGRAVWRDNFPIAAVVGNFETYDRGERFRIAELWVVPEERESGIMKQLLDDLKNTVSFRGVSNIYTTAEEERVKALGELGFDENSTLKVMRLR